MPFYGYNPPNNPQPNPFYQPHMHPQPQPLPRYQTSWHINQLTQDRYGTDVPTLWNEIEQLERKLKHRSGDLMHCERELKDLRHRHRKLKENYEQVKGLYDRAMEILRDERERRRWRPRRLY